MKKQSKLLLARYIRGFARYTLLVVLLLTSTFAILSGSGDYGGGITGILKNSMNALPWIILLIFLYVAWKWELIGGILFTIIGLVALYFFNFGGGNFFLFTFILCLSIVILGSLFIVSWYLEKSAADRDA